MRKAKKSIYCVTPFKSADLRGELADLASKMQTLVKSEFQILKTKAFLV